MISTEVRRGIAGRWVRSGKSGLDSQQQEILIALLQRVATAREASAHKTAVTRLPNIALYKTNKHVQDYEENVWMSCVERWAKAFQKQQMLNIVNTNNGVEAQNKHLKYDYLPRSVDTSVFGIAVLLVESFILDSYQHYLDTNLHTGKIKTTYRLIYETSQLISLSTVFAASARLTSFERAMLIVYIW